MSARAGDLACVGDDAARLVRLLGDLRASWLVLDGQRIPQPRAQRVRRLLACAEGDLRISLRLLTENLDPWTKQP